MKGKKILALLVTLIFLVSTAGGLIQAGENGTNKDKGTLEIAEEIDFSTPKIVEGGKYTQINVDGVTSDTTGFKGKPLLPVKKTVFKLPMGARIQSVEVSHSSVKTKNIEGNIEPVPEPFPYICTSFKGKNTKDEQGNPSTIDENYNFPGYYPEKWYEYSVRVGLDENNEHTTFLTINVYPVRYSAEDNKIQYVSDVNVNVHYNVLSSFSVPDVYDLLILSGSAYTDDLQKLVTHKENRGIRTKLVSVDEIIGEGRDKAEQIKYYIKEGIEKWNITYVMLVGGHRSFLGFDKPALQLPLRYVHLDDGGEPGYVSDLYYADVYHYDEDSGTYEFDSWDTDNDNRFGEWYDSKEDDVDLMPDVHLGRLACRKESEVQIMVDKIINYENNDYTNQNWFKKMVVITGDDFQDQCKLDINWDTTGLEGEYTIHAQSTNENNETGPEDTVTVTVNHMTGSTVTFSENDHLTTSLNYPHPPVAEITVPSDGDVLGEGDVTVNSPVGAYIGYRWTPINYTANVMHIMGKTYNPQPQPTNGVNTTIKVWITNSTGETVFGPVLNQSAMYYEGEWVTHKALNYMPNDFEKIRLWSSKGTFHGTEDDPIDGKQVVINQLNEGSGFVYFAGHANPMVWADHYPGIPGGRHNADIKGLTQFDPFHGVFPLSNMFPLNQLENGKKQPVVVLSGCHPCQLDVSFLNLFTEISKFYHGTWIWESLGWWLTRLEDGGAIATLGQTGLGYGGVGKWCTKGVGGWLCPEFFRQYSQEGKHILGEAFTQSLINYINEFGPDLDLIDTKTVEEMVLLGDPTLEIG